jgi:multicomponent Na+:H+ antiporter subunit B
MEEFIDVIILAFMAASVVAIVRLRNLFAVVMLSGIYSLLAASMFVVLDAVDVAFTEAAVGAGISTVLFIGTLALVSTRTEKAPAHRPLLPLLVVIVTGGVLIYGSLDMARFGDANAPAHMHVAPYYLAKSVPETTVPNVVTAVLASYRGYDTLGETTVIFTAGIGVILLLGSWRRGLEPPPPHSGNRKA